MDASKTMELKTIIYKKKLPSYFNKSTQVNLLICKHLKGSVHLAGQNGPLWLDEKAFITNNIKVYYQKINFKNYPQFSRSTDFCPGLSIIDLIANHGSSAKNFLGFNSKFVSREELLESTFLTGR